MELRKDAPTYVIVSPVRDEERYVELTLRSVTEQTIKPSLWVIVDDGSSDRTVEIVRRYAALHSFIQLVRLPRSGKRSAGAPVIRAFECGYAQLGELAYDVIVKLDCDLSFGTDYFATLLDRFVLDPKLGIASGIYLEASGSDEWTPIRMPSYHAFGASKVVRRRCFEDIGGFPAAPGWDTVDEIKAMAQGWRTGHFEDLEVWHHKREGSGVGPLKTNRMHGEIFYTTGGDLLFFLAKALHRTSMRPWLVGSLALVYGYALARLQRKPLLVSQEEKRIYRRLLRNRLVGGAETLDQSFLTRR